VPTRRAREDARHDSRASRAVAGTAGKRAKAPQSKSDVQCLGHTGSAKRPIVIPAPDRSICRDNALGRQQSSRHIPARTSEPLDLILRLLHLGADAIHILIDAVDELVLLAELPVDRKSELRGSVGIGCARRTSR